MSFTTRRQVYNPVRRPPTDPAKKRKQAGLNHELNLEVEDIVACLLARCNAAAEKFKKPNATIRALVFGGSKGAAFVTRRRVGKEVRIYDAYVHHRSKEFNSDGEVEKRGGQILKLQEMKALISAEEFSYAEQAPEIQQAWVHEYREDLAVKDVQKRVNKKAEQQDASYMHKMIAREMQTSELRTGVKAVYIAVRSNQFQVIQPFYACSPDVLQFFSIMLGKTLDQIVALFEMWAIGGIQGVLGVNTRSAADVLKEVRRLIQSGLSQILTKRYPDKTMTVDMNYLSYDTEIVMKHGVKLVGWTYGDGTVCQPGKITPVAELRKLYTALISEACHWELMSADEWDPANYVPKQRGTRSDAGEKRKSRKTAATDSPHTEGDKQREAAQREKAAGTNKASRREKVAGKNKGQRETVAGKKAQREKTAGKNKATQRQKTAGKNNATQCDKAAGNGKDTRKRKAAALDDTDDSGSDGDDGSENDDNDEDDEESDEDTGSGDDDE